MKTVKAILFWAASVTWGILMTIPGFFMFIILLCCGKKPRVHKYAVFFEVGDNWGGVCLGPFFAVSRALGKSGKEHEFGHSLQNIMFGPLFPFVCGIPSLLRCGLSNLWGSGLKAYFYLVGFGVFSCVSFIACSALVVTFYTMWAWVCLVVSGYLTTLTIFLCAQYRLFTVDGVIYDAFWVEGTATRLGKKFSGSCTQS